MYKQTVDGTFTEVTKEEHSTQTYTVAGSQREMLNRKERRAIIAEHKRRKRHEKVNPV